MKVSKQIKALSMLLIILIMMMHNAFPHVHHQHDGDDAVVAGGQFHHHEDHHHGNHHHSDESDNDDEQSNLLDYLFNNHSHPKHTHQYTPTTVEHVKPVRQVVSSLFYLADTKMINFGSVEIALHRYVLFKSHVPNQPYLRSHPLRGPPNLG